MHICREPLRLEQETSSFDKNPVIGNKSNIYERDWSKFDKENFILDYFFVEWEDFWIIDDLNADSSTNCRF